ncbi:hypothetical protein PB1_07632 [Bacillus methanolicus PB1]|uniref:Cytoplasmic protein n=1 Tax=Bacillus methanolicus PB1 TaxID=997296 RepID=I3E143_BACMT|nr:DUF1836 domain-containing protein [Bacillus methanolicus]EIJ80214.1 hypothetical protein PB1_07632 [Bacillus methanolicus PB1]
MEKVNEIIADLGFENIITLEDLPKIDLYMDQVIQLFEQKYGATKRTEDEKVLTKTMINNYAKGKLFFSIKNKKYSKEHLILISLIYQLKGALSLNDIKTTLDGLNEKIIAGDFNLEAFYESYLYLFTKNVESFKEDIEEKAKDVNEEITKLEEQDSQYLEKALFIATLVNISNLYRRVAEKLVDEIKECKKS